MIFASTMLILASQMATIVGRSKPGEFYLFVQNTCAVLRIQFFFQANCVFVFNTQTPCAEKEGRRKDV
jgi:hypothetical protein